MVIKAEIQQMEDLWKQRKNEQAFQLFLEHMNEIHEFLLWVEQEQVIEKEDFQRLVKYLYQAIENRDSVLLQDVVLYALLDIINQLLATDE